MNAIYKSDEGQRLVESRYRDLLTRWPVPSEQRSISTSFGDTFVVACGPPSMSPVVLLQGSGGNAAMWLSDVATLSASHRVYCVDVIGEPGLSAPSRPRLDAPTYASWLREVLDGLGVGACLGHRRIAGRVARAGFCDGGTSTRGSPRARKHGRSRPGEGQLCHQDAGTDADGQLGTAQSPHAGCRPHARQTRPHGA
jgi:hypothetical protein